MVILVTEEASKRSILLPGDSTNLSVFVCLPEAFFRLIAYDRFDLNAAVFLPTFMLSYCIFVRSLSSFILAYLYLSLSGNPSAFNGKLNAMAWSCIYHRLSISCRSSQALSKKGRGSSSVKGSNRLVITLLQSSLVLALT